MSNEKCFIESVFFCITTLFFLSTIDNKIFFWNWKFGLFYKDTVNILLNSFLEIYRMPSLHVVVQTRIVRMAIRVAVLATQIQMRFDVPRSKKPLFNKFIFSRFYTALTQICLKNFLLFFFLVFFQTCLFVVS